MIVVTNKKNPDTGARVWEHGCDLCEAPSGVAEGARYKPGYPPRLQPPEPDLPEGWLKRRDKIGVLRLYCPKCLGVDSGLHSG